MKYKVLRRTAIALILGMLMICSVGYAENVDPDNDGSQYAWGENVGWINFEPSQGEGVTVTDSAVTGKAWGENIGWIKLSHASGGVVNDGAGNLSGYAWGENVGWINFGPTNAGVRIDPATGVFSGKAWGENIGWINFAPNGVPIKTSWRGVIDNCPDDPNKTVPGICGCGIADTDSDSDGTPDCNDGCPNDPNKINPGTCGCGIADTDSDSDGIPNCKDNCPNTYNPDQTDTDDDGIGDACENAKISGGAYFYPETTRYKASFSMDVTGPSSPSGWLKYYYSRTRMNFVSTAITSVSKSGNTATISGTGTVNGVGGYTFTATVTDGTPDNFGITINKKPDGSLYYSAGPKAVSGGNLIISLL